LLAGVSCCVLGGAACGGTTDTGDPGTVSADEESVLVAQVLGDSAPALMGPASADGERQSSLPVPPVDHVPRPSGRPGNFRVLDWAGFRGAVTYTFDDSQPSQIEHYAELQAAGVPVTFYLSSGWENTSPQYVATWQQAVRDGHEIGNHTAHHCNADLTGCAAGDPLADPLAEIDVNAAYIAEHTGQRLTLTMASPFGDANWDAFARQRVFLHRDVFQGLVAPNDNTDPFHLPTMMAGAPEFGGIDDQQSTFEGLIDTARSTDSWLNFLFHTILPTTNNWFGPVDIGAITGSMQHAKSSRDVWIDTMLQIGAYWRAQKLFSGLTPIRIGPVTIWTWQLPDHFPRGKFLRVRVDGGTLRQLRGPLRWNQHGFYEVALDDRVLVLTP
jgi:peptidoglycan/xylan/chitin deacetylase (PgdA/CDA1 family)